jgi:hypothetical protein
MISLMSDGRWHHADELVDRISHRFSATIHILKPKGYRFEKRKVNAKQYEYRMIVEQSV